MDKKAHVWRNLIVYSLSALALSGIGAVDFSPVHASHYRARVTSLGRSARQPKTQGRKSQPRVANGVHQQRLQRLKQRVQQHRKNLRRYRHLKRQHLINLRRLNRRKRNQAKHRRHLHYGSDVVRNRNYDFYKNYKMDVDTVDPRNSYHEIEGNDKVRFGHPIYLHYTRHVHNNYGHPHGDPQSMAILPDGGLYVLFNAGHGDSSLNRIFKYNVKNGKLLKVGRVFKGGHGQGLSYDYKTGQLWMCDNHYRYKGHPRGILPKALIIIKVDPKTLKPYGRHVYVKSRDSLGENFTYDKSGDYWNVARSYRKNNPNAPRYSLQIYRGDKNGKLRLMKDLLHSPSACIQNLTYNPGNNRLYVVGNGVILSFPANRIHRLNNREIKVAVMNHHSEFEDLGFWHRRAYLLVHPDRILRSNRDF